MNPIKSHLLNRLRPQVQHMTTMTDEEAFAMGYRAIKAGMTYRIGTAILFWWKAPGGFMLPRRRGVIVDIGKEEGDIRVDDGAERVRCRWGGGLVPDLRDPGTKGHAVAQLRERTGDPFLSTYGRTRLDSDEVPVVVWDVQSDDVDLTAEHPTEEEAIVAAFETTKETP